MKRHLLVMLLACLVLVATAAPAFDIGATPGIGGGPPGDGSAHPKSVDNPGADNRAETRTGGQSVHFGLKGEPLACGDKPIPFCQQP
jgi:hypothetical protein